MIERFLGCIVASLVVWLSLVYFISESSMGLTFAYVALYADTFLAVLVFCLLFFVHVLPLLLLRALNGRLLPGHDVTALVKFSYESEQWPVTTISHLESLKSQLQQIENRARYLQTSEHHVREFYKEDPPAWILWLAERGVSILKKQCWKESGTANSLRQTISRLHAGDVDHELLNYQEQIADLQSQKNYRDSDSITQWINDGIDRKIRAAQRNITELQTWSNKVAAANPVSPYEANWRLFLDYVKSTSAAPYILATGHMQAAFAGIETKRAFEQKVSELRRSGRITDQEADYLYQRIQQEFFMGAKPQYSGV
jgi:hypothetical protein